MRTQRLKLLGTVSSRGEAAGQLRSPGDAVLVERGRPRLLLLACPCGCGEEFPVNLDPRAGPAWRIYGTRSSALSLFPSVWRESGCESHYIIWRGKILLFGQRDDEFEEEPETDTGAPSGDAVLAQLPYGGLISFSDVAEALDAVPWDVLKVCRRLVRQGLAREGSGKERGSFGRKGPGGGVRVTA